MTPAPPPSGNGFLVYVKELSSGNGELYRQNMIGSTPSGPAYSIKDSALITNLVRYPAIFPEGDFIYFVARKVGTNGGIYDELVVTRNDGSLLWKSRHVPSGCKTVNYPHLLWWRVETTDGTLSFRIAATCADNWGSRYSISWEVDELDPANGSGAVVKSSPTAFGAVVYEPLVTEIASVPVKLPDTAFHFGEPFEVFTSHNGKMRWDSLMSISHFDGCCSDSFGGYYEGAVYAWPLHYLAAGHATPVEPTPLVKAYAPSVSPDGYQLMFNSEAFKSDSSRGKELFTMLVPSKSFCEGFGLRRPYKGGPLLPLISGQITQLTNGRGNEYGEFVVNNGSNPRAYVMWRHDDPANSGRSTLYVAPNLTTSPIRLHSGSQSPEYEASWFFDS